MEIVEAYKDWQPPIDGRKGVAAALSAVPKEHLIGIDHVVLTNATGLNRKQRRKKTKHRGRTRHSNEALGSYVQPWNGRAAYINLFVDNIIAQCPRAVKLPAIRDALFADVLFHEIGHHIHVTRTKQFREREDVADDWARSLGEIYLRRRRWYLAPLIKLLGLERTFHMRLSSRA
ncbi:MAG: hypothetical protein ACREA9_08065 [Pyrinomonadaceae bacterium]